MAGEEPAMERVGGLLSTGAVMSWMNAVEVYYRVERLHGRAEAEAAMAAVRRSFTLDLPGPARMIEAARLKAVYPIALGDCFAIATAAAHGLPLLTGDPEILDQISAPCVVEDLRSSAR
jgi:predicted nucleic acid-binding protein